MGEQGPLAACLEEFAGLSSTLANPDGAARLLGAADRLREKAEFPLKPVDRDRHGGHLAAARQALQDDAFDRAWSEGRSWTVDEAVRFALRL